MKEPNMRYVANRSGAELPSSTGVDLIVYNGDEVSEKVTVWPRSEPDFEPIYGWNGTHLDLVVDADEVTESLIKTSLAARLETTPSRITIE